MQIKVITVDLQLTPRAKRAIRWLLMPAAAFGGSLAIAHAALNPAPSTWAQNGLPVSAADLQQNLTDLQRLSLTWNAEAAV